MSAIAAVVWVWITCTRCDGTGTYRHFGVCFRCGDSPRPGHIRIRQDSLDRQRAEQAATAANSARRATERAAAFAAIDWTEATPCHYSGSHDGCGTCIGGWIPNLDRNPQLVPFTD